ncbi:MAG: hypothetical protein AAFZ92_05935 [Pseudomonadota bacterium]
MLLIKNLAMDFHIRQIRHKLSQSLSKVVFFTLLSALSFCTYAEQYYWASNSGLRFVGAFTSALAACQAGVADVGTSYSSMLPGPYENRFGCYGKNRDTLIPEEKSYASAIRVKCPSTGRLPYYLAAACSPPKLNDGDNDNNTCNPINIATGKKFYQAIDYQDNDFTVSRYYNAYGYWTFNYTQDLILLPGIISIASGRTYNGYIYSPSYGKMLVRRADGAEIEFDYTINAETGTTYTAPSHRKERLDLVNNDYNNHVIERYRLGDFLYLPYTHKLTTRTTIEKYDSKGKLTAISQPGNADITIEYKAPHDKTDWPSAISLTKQGRTLSYHYSDKFPRIQTIITPDGASLQYHYRNEHAVSAIYRGVLSQVIYTDPLGQSRVINSYSYQDNNNAHLITGVNDSNDQVISSVQYDYLGRVVSSEKGPAGSGIERTQITYHNNGSRTLTNALGKRSTYHFTEINGEYKMTEVEGHPSANCAGANQAYTYDDNGFIASLTDWNGNITTYTHNSRGQELSRTEASGTPEARTITTQWHPELNLPIKITELGRETLMTYNADGHLLSRQINKR